MASDPLSCILLMGLGYTSLSVAPPALPLVRWLVRTVPIAAAEQAAKAALEVDRTAGVTAAIREHVKPYIDLRIFEP